MDCREMRVWEINGIYIKSGEKIKNIWCIKGLIKMLKRKNGIS